jgi:hypothetical protein
MKKLVAVAALALAGSALFAGTAGAATVPSALKPVLTAGGMNDTMCWWLNGRRSCTAFAPYGHRVRYALNMGSWQKARDGAVMVNQNATVRSELRATTRELTGKTGWHVVRPATAYRVWTMVLLRR